MQLMTAQALQSRCRFKAPRGSCGARMRILHWRRRAASAGEGAKDAVPKLDLLPPVKCSVPKDSLVELTWRSDSPAPMCERKVVEEEQLARLQADLHHNRVDQ